MSTRDLKYEPDGRRIAIAPSLLAADFARLAEQLAAIEDEADMLHLDIMDGHFVPNISFGPPLLRKLRPVTRLAFDVHLMIEDADRYLDDFIAAGADTITVHIEAAVHVARVLERIREAGAKAGITLNPGTSLASLDAVLPLVDQVLVMSVNPGFGGQSYLPQATGRIRALRARIDRDGLDCRLQVDGGVNLETCREVVAAGADILVAGSAIFGAADPAAAIREMRQRCSG